MTVFHGFFSKKRSIFVQCRLLCQNLIETESNQRNMLKGKVVATLLTVGAILVAVLLCFTLLVLTGITKDRQRMVVQLQYMSWTGQQLPELENGRPSRVSKEEYRVYSNPCWQQSGLAGVQIVKNSYQRSKIYESIKVEFILLCWICFDSKREQRKSDQYISEKDYTFPYYYDTDEHMDILHVQSVSRFIQSIRIKGKESNDRLSR